MVIHCELAALTMAARLSSRAWLLGIAAGLLLAGCSGGGGERRFRYAEAVEVPAAVTERDQLAALLAGFAQRNGLAFHDTSPRAQRLSNGRQTMALLVQRPLTNGRLWDEVAVSAQGNTAALVTFAEPLAFCASNTIWHAWRYLRSSGLSLAVNSSSKA